jgi:hypothetical protein
VSEIRASDVSQLLRREHPQQPFLRVDGSHEGLSVRQVCEAVIVEFTYDTPPSDLKKQVTDVVETLVVVGEYAVRARSVSNMYVSLVVTRPR